MVDKEVMAGIGAVGGEVGPIQKAMNLNWQIGSDLMAAQRELDTGDSPDIQGQGLAHLTAAFHGVTALRKMILAIVGPMIQPTPAPNPEPTPAPTPVPMSPPAGCLPEPMNLEQFRKNLTGKRLKKTKYAKTISKTGRVYWRKRTQMRRK